MSSQNSLFSSRLSNQQRDGLKSGLTELHAQLLQQMYAVMLLSRRANTLRMIFCWLVKPMARAPAGARALGRVVSPLALVFLRFADKDSLKLCLSSGHRINRTHSFLNQLF